MMLRKINLSETDFWLFYVLLLIIGGVRTNENHILIHGCSKCAFLVTSSNESCEGHYVISRLGEKFNRRL